MNMDGYLYVGTYNKPVLMGTGEIYRGNGKGISIFGMDFRTGETELIDVMENIPNPSFLAADGTGRFLYAVNELDMFEEKEGPHAGSASMKDILCLRQLITAAEA